MNDEIKAGQLRIWTAKGPDYGTPFLVLTCLYDNVGWSVLCKNEVMTLSTYDIRHQSVIEATND